MNLRTKNRFWCTDGSKQPWNTQIKTAFFLHEGFPYETHPMMDSKTPPAPINDHHFTLLPLHSFIKLMNKNNVYSKVYKIWNTVVHNIRSQSRPQRYRSLFFYCPKREHNTNQSATRILSRILQATRKSERWHPRIYPPHQYHPIIIKSYPHHNQPILLPSNLFFIKCYMLVTMDDRTWYWSCHLWRHKNIQINRTI